jgi:hypothetical protein
MAPGNAITPVVKSHWLSHAIDIDGRNADWGDVYAPLVPTALNVACINDSASLYVSLTTSDRRLEAGIAAAGLTVWFDSSGGTRPQTGIRFPTCGFDPEVMRSVMRGSTDEGNDLAAVITNRTVALEVMGGGSAAGIRPVAQAASIGIDASLGLDSGRMVYELKVPLLTSASTPLAVGAGCGRTISVSLRSCDVSLPESPSGSEGERPQRAMGSGGSGGGMGGGRHGGGMGSGGSGDEMGGGRHGGGHGGGRPDAATAGGDRAGRPDGQQPPKISTWFHVSLAQIDSGSGNH